MDFIQLLFWSSLFAALILLFVLILRKNIVGVSRVNRIGLFQAMLFGLLNPFLYYLVLFKAYSLLPAQVAQPLNYIWPIVLVLMSAVFLKQRLHWYDLLALFVSFCGVVLISSQESIKIFDTSNPIGVVLALASSVIWASFWILNMKSAIKDETMKLFLSFCFAAVYGVVVLIASGRSFCIGWQGAASALYIGTFEMGITFVLWLKALNLATNTARIGNFSYLVPFIALVFISLVLHEKIYLTTLFGLILIVGAILFQQRVGKDSR